VPLEDRAGLAPAARAALERATARHVTLADVIRWGLAQDPQRLVDDVVVQDEYTHDVIVPLAAPLHLVYDTT
jgi:hypothetical protein